MVCPFCLHNKTLIYNSRSTKKINSTWRRHRCTSCGQEFTTYEVIETASILRVAKKPSAQKSTPFYKTKLLLSVLKACDHRPNNDDAYWLCETIEQKLLNDSATHKSTVVSTETIKDVCLDVLKNFDAVAFVKYLTNHTNAPTDARAITRRLK